MATESNILFTPIQQFNNRIVMAPMTRSRAIDNIPNDLMAEYYSQRATAGLIITEGTSPSPNGLGYPRIPGIFTDEQIEGWKKTTDAVHVKGGKIFIQFMHVGRIGSYENLPEGATLVAPSGISAFGDMFTDTKGMVKTDVPEALTLEGIKSTIQEFVHSAKNAIAAGFDGVELHGANGYLLEQFLNPNANTRTDEYGGSIENRTRFVIEVTKAVADAIGKDNVGIRFSPYNDFNTMPPYDEVYETYEYLAKEINKIGVAYIHLLDGAARKEQKGLELISAIRAYFNGILILNSGYTKEKATGAIASNEADMVSFGTLYISNPDLVSRFENERYLTQAEESTFYTPGEKGYTDYPVYKG